MQAIITLPFIIAKGKEHQAQRIFDFSAGTKKTKQNKNPPKNKKQKQNKKTTSNQKKKKERQKNKKSKQK